jgi:Tfp pilus assembly protein PilX
MMKTSNRQTGFSAIIVVILIVLFALLGAYMSTMSSIGSLNTTQSASAMQAWFTARSGVEWAVHQSLAASDGGCTCAVDCCTGIDAQILNFTEAGLNGYQATVSCSASNYTEASASYCVYELDVSATNNSPAQLTSVSRTITISISDRNAP